MPAQKSPLDRLLDVGVYAPLGFLVAGDKAVADLAVVGRKQVAFTRSLGRAAITAMTAGSQADTTTNTNSRHPVPEYESMTAREVVEMLAGSEDARVRWILGHESSNKQRVTILRAAARVLG